MSGKILSSGLKTYIQGRPRVVVTGLGLVTSLGLGVQHVWNRLIQGESGIVSLSGREFQGIPSKVGGVVPRGSSPGAFDPTAHFDNHKLKNLFDGTIYALVAAKEAIGMSKWKPSTPEEQYLSGVAVGMGMVDMEYIANTGITLREKGYKRVGPHFIPRILINMPAGHISLEFSFRGPNHSVSTACTTGVHAIGDAMNFIQMGKANVMVCGGTEASLAPLGLAGFARMRALSTNFNDSPTEASRPFDKDRDGFVMSEGAGIIVLEELEHAKNRGANIYGEILGYGLSGDANHITAPCEDGDGAFRCMTAALKDANMLPTDIGYINAHATSTPLGDAAEYRAISKLFRDNMDVAVSSTKSSVGHLLGAAGCVEAIFTILACNKGVIPATLNCHNPDKEFSNMNLVPIQSQKWNNYRRIALTNSFGFGGTNASLCISSYHDNL